MTAVSASAPGKLVLLGEYAVLEGAPALVAAINRRAVVHAAPRNDGQCVITAPDVGISDATMVIDGKFGPRWQCSVEDAAKLRLVDQICTSLWHEGLIPQLSDGFDLRLDTQSFFGRHGNVRAKLGLGSSAALTVAIASALVVIARCEQLLDDRVQWLRQLFGMHSTWQDGRGSGVDLAASVAGGLNVYCLEEGLRPAYLPLQWPVVGLHCLFVWSGEAVSTVDYLARLAQWRTHHSIDYAAHMRELGLLSEAAINAVRACEPDSFTVLVSEYADALKRFGEASGLRIFSPGQQRIATLSRRAGVAFKPCGAGGDVGVVFATDAMALTSVAADVTGEGFQCVPLKVDPHGLIASSLAVDSRLLDGVH